MRVSDEHLDDFIKRWKHAFNEELSRDEAQAKAGELLELYRMLSRRPPGEEEVRRRCGKNDDQEP